MTRQWNFSDELRLFVMFEIGLKRDEMAELLNRPKTQISRKLTMFRAKHVSLDDISFWADKLERLTNKELAASKLARKYAIKQQTNKTIEELRKRNIELVTELMELKR